MQETKIGTADGLLNPSRPPKRGAGTRLKTEAKRNYALYLMILPVVVFFVIFSYFPMVGLIAAFKDYKPTQGIFGSPWASNLQGETDALYHFRLFFSDPYFGRLLRNTLMFSFMDILFVFPAPIILALLLHSIQGKKYRRVTQTLVYMPYFISMVVVCGIIRDFTSANGIFGVVFQKLGLVGAGGGNPRGYAVFPLDRHLFQHLAGNGLREYHLYSFPVFDRYHAVRGGGYRRRGKSGTAFQNHPPFHYVHDHDFPAFESGGHTQL